MLPLFSRKLGTCAKCIRLSILLAVSSWFTFAIFSAYLPSSLPTIATFAAALGFTLLAASHAVAFAIRMMLKLNRVVGPGCCGDDKFSSNRRRFIVSSLKLTLAAFVFAAIPRQVMGQIAHNCPGATQTWPAKTVTATFLVCAENCGDVRDKLQHTAQGALEFCIEQSSGFCGQKNCDPEIQDCQVVKALPQGKAKVSVKTCKEKRPRQRCDDLDPKKTVHEITLEVKGGNIVCECGCVQPRR